MVIGSVETRYGLSLPPRMRPALTGRAETFERFGRPLHALGPAFVVAAAAERADR